MNKYRRSSINPPPPPPPPPPPSPSSQMSPLPLISPPTLFRRRKLKSPFPLLSFKHSLSYPLLSFTNKLWIVLIKGVGSKEPVNRFLGKNDKSREASLILRRLRSFAVPFASLPEREGSERDRKRNQAIEKPEGKKKRNHSMTASSLADLTNKA